LYVHRKRSYRLIWHTTVWSIWYVHRKILMDEAKDVESVVVEIKHLSVCFWSGVGSLFCA
jgi:hypothetical protein